MEKVIKVFSIMILLFSMSFMFSINANATTNVMWGKTELKLGQIGKVTILSNTTLVKIESNGSLSEVRPMKNGEEYRVYSFKAEHNGLYGVGGGSFVKKDVAKIKYETPSKAKLALLEEMDSTSTTIMWGKTELKLGQIGKVTILSDTNLVKLESDGSLSTVRSLKEGEEYRVYSYKSNQGGLYGVGNGSFVQKNSKTKYETPSKSKLALLNEQTQATRALGYSEVLTTPEIAKKTESKIVTMHLKNDNNEWVATGIVIGDGYILVNMYAIEGVTSGRVITSDNRSFELQGAAFANDSLAIMKTKVPMGVVGIPLQPSVKTLVKNERIVTVELEEGKSGLFVTEGTFDSSFYFQNLLYNSTHDEASITMPGGAVVNARGYLIGLQTKGFRSPVNGARVSIASDEIIKVFQPFLDKKFSEVPATFYSSPF